MNEYFYWYGGSWEDNQWDVRCAYHLWLRPEPFGDDLGFRLVLRSG